MHLKTVIKTIIAEFHERGVPKTIQRDIPVSLNTQKIVTLIGARRAGKTSLLYQLIQQIPDITDVLYINFEDERLGFQSGDLQTIFDAYYELYPTKQSLVVFFDEIQEVPDWEKFVRRVYDTITKNIFITGSSAKMLSKELATALRGRTITYEVFPLSFKEFLRFKNVSYNIHTTQGRAQLHSFLLEYLERGGFPETINMEYSVYKKTMSNYFDVMLYRDVIDRYPTVNPIIVRKLLHYLLSQTANEFSVHKQYNDFKSQGLKTGKDILYSYVDYFTDAYIIQPISNYASSVRKQTVQKSYAIDTGLARSLSVSLSEDFGRLLETAVLLDLKRREQEVFYYKYKGECDFVVKHQERIVQAIQVCFDLNKANAEREVAGLKSAMNRFSLDSGIILTCSDFDIDDDSINVISAWNWFLESDD